MRTLKSFIYEAVKAAQGINAFVILKPEFLKYQEQFEDMLKNNDWQIIQHKKFKMPLKTAQELYKMHEKKDFYKDLCEYMSSDDCICYTLSKDIADPIKDMDKLKDKVRKTWGKDDMKNAMHSSDSEENVKRESNIIFN